MTPLQQELGNIDIYLLDQILRDRLNPKMRILDAGCGGGRNLVYFLKNGYDVSAVDQDPIAVEQVRAYAAHLPAANFRCEPIEAMSFPDNYFDFVISNAVLHFAQSDAQFEAMVIAMWNKLRPGGVLFCRLASSIGIESQIKGIEGRRHWLPDGSDRYLVDAELLHHASDQLGGHLLDPIKTTVVDQQRAMTTWVLAKA